MLQLINMSKSFPFQFAFTLIFKALRILKSFKVFSFDKL